MADWLGKHAIVIGGSMAGMLAARVLSDHFERVTVLDRAALPDNPAGGETQPQAQHLNAVLMKGAQILEELFPGIQQALTDQGAVALDATGDGRWFTSDLWRDSYVSGIRLFSMTRPLVERTVRARLYQRPHVALMDQTVVSRLLTTPDRGRVTGVELIRAGEVSRMSADLVVEAGGRSTLAGQWLQELGYGAVPVSTLRVDLVHATRFVRFAPSVTPDWKLLAITGTAPDTRSGSIIRVEENRWLVSLFGLYGDHPAADEASFRTFARGLAQPHLQRVLEHAEPLTPVALHRFPGYLRRHYERMERFPESFLVMGDAACSFNPVHGQGMTMAALGASVLAECLQEQHGGPVGVAGRFQRRLAAATEPSWQACTRSDLAYPQAEGRRPFAARLAAWYTRRLLRLAARDRRLNNLFVQVLHLLKEPTELFRPAVVLRVLAGRAPIM